LRLNRRALFTEEFQMLSALDVMMFYPNPPRTVSTATVAFDAVRSDPTMVLSNSNLTVTRNTTSDGTDKLAIGNTPKVDRYFEMTTSLPTGFTGRVGVWDGNVTTPALGADDASIGYTESGNVATGGANVKTGLGTWGSGTHVIGCAVKNGKVYFRLDGTWQGCDPVAETGGVAINTTFFSLSSVYPAVQLTWHSDTMTANFGGTAFNAAAPTGTAAWNT
jgi:hypothetical protein